MLPGLGTTSKPVFIFEKSSSRFFLQLSASHFPKRLHVLTILASSRMSPTDIPIPDACAASETSYMMRALTSRMNASPCLWQ